MTAVTDVLRGSATLLAGRFAQAIVGVAILVATTRALELEGFGDFATALAVASLLGGVLSASLSDSYITFDIPTHPRALGVTSCGLTAAATAGLGAATGSSSGALAGFSVGCYVTVSVVTAGRMAAARSAGRSTAIAVVQLSGSVATAVAVVCLGLADNHRWQLFLLAYALQPAALALLGPAPTVPQQSPVRLVTVWRASRMFVAAQIGWTVITQVNVVLLRVLAGPEAAGRYAALVRLLDFLAIVAPLMAVLALPAFVKAQRSNAQRGEAAVLNIVIAGVGTVVLVAGMQFGWLGWRLLYGDTDFPATVFAVVGLGYGVSAACGLPDRLLQAAGSPAVAAKYAAAAAAGSVVLGALLVPVAGATGAAAALAVVLACVNIGMLRSTRPTARVATVHVALGLVVLCAAALVVTGEGADSPLVSVGLASGLSVLAVLPLYWFRQSLRQHVVATH